MALYIVVVRAVRLREAPRRLVLEVEGRSVRIAARCAMPSRNAFADGTENVTANVTEFMPQATPA